MLICSAYVSFVGCIMNAGNAVPVSLGLVLVVIGLVLYRTARRAPAERRYFRFGAYVQMFVLIFAGAFFIVIGILY
jgi:uncharacterized membrane protein